MKVSYDEYMKKNNIQNLHPELNNIINELPTDIYESKNIILYGPYNVGKYTQALKIASIYSPTNLKYEKKIIIPTNKNPFNIKISDVHFDIDMEILGYNSKSLWNDVYLQIIEIIKSRKINKGIIICKNFHTINNELLEIFFSYMRDDNVSFILCTEHVSFIPNKILNICLKIDVKKPSQALINKCDNVKIASENTSEIFDNNIKINNDFSSHILNDTHVFNNRRNELIETITNNLINYKSIKFITLRDNIYNIFIYNIDIYSFLFDIINTLYNKNINNIQNDVQSILLELFYSLKYYNNNYRPIYHIEKYLLYLSKVINEF
tara:strand:+ start:581 stop:1546 length:966 start_codon:yes stop_codon:yes gene_type:complete